MYIFDLDGTLMNGLDGNWRSLDGLEPIEVTHAFFEIVKGNGKDVLVLTARHPDLKEEIEDLVGCDVRCREVLLNDEDVFRIGENKFHDVIANWKSKVVNEIKKNGNYKNVLFMDDRIDRYEGKLVDGVIGLLPIHLWSTEYMQKMIDEGKV